MPKKNEHFDPQFRIKGSKSIVYARQASIAQMNKNGKQKSNRWTQKQQKKYVNFVKNNFDKFQNPKKFKTFLLMSRQIKTRSCDQCKSHHFKMMIKFHKSLELIANSRQMILKIENPAGQVFPDLSSNIQENLQFEEDREVTIIMMEIVEINQARMQIQNKNYVDCSLSEQQEQIFDVLTL